MSETRDDLREALVAFMERYALPAGTTIDREMTADALIADPLAPILAQVSALQAEVERWKTSFDGHVYVTDADFDALCRRAERAEAEVERLQNVEGEREKGRVPDGTGLSPKGEAPDGSSSQSDFDPSRGPLADFARQMIRHAWNGEDVDGGTIQDTAASLGLLREEPYDPKKHGGTTLCEIGDTWFVFAGPLARASDEHPAGEDPKGLRAKPASAVANGDAPSDNPLTETKEGSEHV